MIRVLIVDDEPAARRRIRRLLTSVDDIEIVGEAGDGAAAVEAVTESSPGLVFLDVQMPGQDGFEVLAALPDPQPAIIFVTAYDEYALRAFDVHAVDYLLKPFADDRFHEALDGARKAIAQHDLDQHRAALTALLADRSAGLTRLPIKRGDTVHFVPVEDIEYLRADGHGAHANLKNGARFAVGRSLKQLERELRGTGFVRVHRSCIANLDHAVRLHALFHGEFMIEFGSGAQVKSSRTYTNELRGALRLDAGSN